MNEENGINFELAPSILSADFTKLGEEINRFEQIGVKYLHIDVMDGRYVPNISLGIPVISSIRKATALFFDVHLMIAEPIRYIEEFVKAGADSITVHVEACTHLNRTLQAIRDHKIMAGVALNPSTPPDCLRYVLDDLDMILVMAVNPGFGGQKLIGSTNRKIKEVKTLLKKEEMEHILIEVDGGVTPKNAGELLDAGADILVAGTALLEGNLKENADQFFDVFQKQANKGRITHL